MARSCRECVKERQQGGAITRKGLQSTSKSPEETVSRCGGGKEDGGRECKRLAVATERV